jgi:polyhydroxybutyrate depolymerase
MPARKLFAALTVSAGLGWAALPALAAGTDAVSGDALLGYGKHTDIPAPAGQWGPGDLPSEGPTSTYYIGMTGLSGQNGHTREYKVHVPQSYNPRVATPLLVCLPGLGTTTIMFCANGTETSGPGLNGNTGGLITQSDNNGFILVMAEGHRVSWNAGACCAIGGRLDDVGFIRAMLLEVEQHLNVDTKRIYAVGFSNGGFMAERLACEASDIFPAIVDASGGIVVSGCNPANHVAVLQTHGNKDHIVPYALVGSTTNKWVKFNGCNSATTPASFPNSGGDTTCVSNTGCPADGTITACTVDGGGHCWFGSPSCGTGGGQIAAKIALLGSSNSDFLVNSDIVWPFLRQFHR